MVLQGVPLDLGERGGRPPLRLRGAGMMVGVVEVSAGGHPSVVKFFRPIPVEDGDHLHLTLEDGRMHGLVLQDPVHMGYLAVKTMVDQLDGKQVEKRIPTGELVASRYENGRNLWSDALSLTSISTQVGTLTDVDADPIIDSGQVFALGQGGRMAAYELTTGQRIWELTLAGISTTTIGTEVARSRIEATPRPADCRVASSWRFLISSTDSAKGRYSTLPRSS